MSPPRGVYLHQLRELALSEWKLREQSSVTGFLWTLLNPVLTFLVLYWLFTQWVRNSAPNYAAFLIVGVIQYGFFSSATSYAMTSPLRRRGIMMNFPLDRELLVLSSVASSALSYLIEVALMLVFLVCLGVRPGPAWLCLPLLLAAQFLIVTGVSLCAAVLSARYPDFERIWGIAVTMGFFLTPVFYTMDAIDPGRRRWIRLNPVGRLIESTRDCLIRGRFPDPERIALLLVLAGASAAAGYWFFKSQERRLPDTVLS